MDAKQEFERQVQNLIDKKYPEILRISKAEFLKEIERLKDKVPSGLDVEDFENGYLPFVIAVKANPGESEKLMETLQFNSKPGIAKLFPLASGDFKTLDNVEIPEGRVYLLIDIDRGKETVNVRPEDALDIITMKHRFPLTIDEGIAIITHFPEFLIKNNCFSLLASRTGRDQRVPAIWINGKKQANLGWCWDRNPHTWLGSASCKLRIG